MKFGILLFMCMSFVLLSRGGTFGMRQMIEDVTSGMTSDFKTLNFRAPKGCCQAVLEALSKLADERAGYYQSEPVDFENTDEWKGIVRLHLKVDRAACVSLVLEDSKGRKQIAQDSEHGFMTDRSIYLGPDDKGLLFSYSYISNALYTVFSPNGLQKHIVFHRVPESDLFNDVPKSMTAGERKVRIAKMTRGRRREDIERRFSQLRGVYVADDLPATLSTNGIRRLFLKVNNYNNVHYLEDTEKGLVLRSPWDDSMDGMSMTHAFWGAFSFDGNSIRFVRSAPRLDEWSRIVLEGYVSNKMGKSRYAEYLRSRLMKSQENVKRNLPIWLKGKHLLFRRVDERCIVRATVLVLSNNDEVIKGKDRDRYLELLDDMSYDLRPPMWQ